LDVREIIYTFYQSDTGRKLEGRRGGEGAEPPKMNFFTFLKKKNFSIFLVFRAVFLPNLSFLISFALIATVVSRF